MKTMNVNWPKTKNNVKELINKYNYYSLSVDSKSDSKINDDFLLEQLDSYQNDNIYLKKDDCELKDRVVFINSVRSSFNRLTTEERKIIYWTYFDKEDNYDDRFIANNLGFSLGYYYIKKKETLIRFAYSLGIEEIEDK